MEALYTDMVEKQKLLNSAAKVLRQEFAGLDDVIDEITENISSWYLFPHMQQRPLVINLWGLTGTGKTSLVERLAQLINFGKKFYHFDLGETSWGKADIKNSLEDIYSSANGFPSILAFDEFQHARTLNEVGIEEKNPEHRVVWQLLDSGRFQFPNNHYYLENLYMLIQKLKYMLNNGVKVQNGYVVAEQELYLRMMSEFNEYDGPFEKMLDENKKKKQSSDLMFLPFKSLERLFELTRPRYLCVEELKKVLLTFNGPQTIAFLEKVFNHSNSPRIVDCSRCLIFVMGNLDEVYTMSSDIDPDKDADVFYEQSLKINIPTVKQALRKRFRSEQIARLGNNHIIYPAFSRKTYEKIIRRELEKISNKLEKSRNIRMHFSTKLCNLIYSEGVYPTQGTRPVFSTIHQLINSKLGKILSEMVLKKLDLTHIELDGDAVALKATFYKGNETVHILQIPHKLYLEKLREDKCDDMQAISAVHESGHAIISAILLKTLPELIYSTSVETGSAGYISGKFKWKYISRKEILPRLAMYLGGLAAEKLVFGEENITMGAEEDIRKATEFITEMLKCCAIGRIPGAYHVEGTETRNFLYDPSYGLNQQAEEYLIRAMELAEKTLKEQESLLMHMSDYLSDHRQMKQEEFRKLIEEYASNFNINSLVEDGDLLFYRDHLKKRMHELKKKSVASRPAGNHAGLPLEVQLNCKRQNHEA